MRLDIYKISNHFWSTKAATLGLISRLLARAKNQKCRDNIFFPYFFILEKTFHCFSTKALKNEGIDPIWKAEAQNLAPLEP